MRDMCKDGPIGYDSHLNGDYDGLGCFRGIMWCLPPAIVLWVTFLVTIFH